MILRAGIFSIAVMTIAAGCSNNKDSKSPVDITPSPVPSPVDDKVECVEKQKEALSKTGVSLTGGVDEVKKIISQDAAFYTALPYCSD